MSVVYMILWFVHIDAKTMNFLGETPTAPLHDSLLLLFISALQAMVWGWLVFIQLSYGSIMFHASRIDRLKYLVRHWSQQNPLYPCSVLQWCNKELIESEYAQSRGYAGLRITDLHLRTRCVIFMTFIMYTMSPTLVLRENSDWVSMLEHIL